MVFVVKGLMRPAAQIRGAYSRCLMNGAPVMCCPQQRNRARASALPFFTRCFHLASTRERPSSCVAHALTRAHRARAAGRCTTATPPRGACSDLPAQHTASRFALESQPCHLQPPARPRTRAAEVALTHGALEEQRVLVGLRSAQQRHELHRLPVGHAHVVDACASERGQPHAVPNAAWCVQPHRP
jgi:hypothetical protein